MRPEKATVIEDLKVKLNASPFLILIDYTGLNVAQFSELRTRLAANGAECRVIKNTFLRRAATEAGFSDFAGDLSGQCAIVVGEKDVCGAAKVLKGFRGEFQKPNLKLGVIDRSVITVAQVEALADLPPREVLRAQLLGVMQAPAGTLVRLLNEPASSLARVLKAKSEREEVAA